MRKPYAQTPLNMQQRTKAPRLVSSILQLAQTALQITLQRIRIRGLTEPSQREGNALFRVSRAPLPDKPVQLVSKFRSLRKSDEPTRRKSLPPVAAQELLQLARRRLPTVIHQGRTKLKGLLTASPHEAPGEEFLIPVPRQAVARKQITRTGSRHSKPLSRTGLLRFRHLNGPHSQLTWQPVTRPSMRTSSSSSPRWPATLIRLGSIALRGIRRTRAPELPNSSENSRAVSRSGDHDVKTLSVLSPECATGSLWPPRGSAMPALASASL